MGNIHEHLEEAEHAAHGGHGHDSDPFMGRVGMTMALIAAALAAISLVGHRKHNAVLQMKGDANRLLTESAALKVESSNSFSRFQAKKARIDDQEKSIIFTNLFALASGSEALKDAQVKKWEAYIGKNKVAEKDVKLDERGLPLKNEDGSENDTLGALVVIGKHQLHQAEEKIEQAHHVSEESEHAHHQADGLDWAHLTAELGLVLCTVSVLTKKRLFWISGIVSALAGVGLAASALGFFH